MTEIDDLIEQAKKIKVRKVSSTERPELSKRTWQEILDGKPYPKLWYGKL